MKKYTCEVCDKVHAVYYNSDYPLPDSISEIYNSDQLGRIKKLADTAFIIDNEILVIKGNLQIQTDFSDNLIEHYVWTEIPVETFDEKFEELKMGAQIKLKGKLLSILPFYEKSKNLETTLILDRSNILGRLIIESESQIKSDQESPITKNRFIQMMQRINHPEIWKEKRILNKSFKDRLSDILNKAALEFRFKGRKFVINIENNREILFQLISSELLAFPTNNQIGLHLSNDSANFNYKEIKSRMRDLYKNNSIEKLSLDNIETYQKSYKIDTEQIFLDLILIIENVFEENIDEIELSIFEP